METPHHRGRAPPRNTPANPLNGLPANERGERIRVGICVRAFRAHRAMRR